MINVTIDITTISNSPIIEVVPNVSNVEINVEPTISNNTIEVSSPVKIITIEPSVTETRTVIIDFKRSGSVYEATSAEKGTVKLYNALGQNVDGAATQKAVEDGLNTKVDNNRVLTDVPVGALFTDTDTIFNDTDIQTELDTKVDKVIDHSLLLDTEITKLSNLSGGRVEIDFGEIPIFQKQFIIIDTNVKETSNIIASLAYEAPTNKELDELEMDSLSITCGQAALGSFKMFIKSIDGSYLSDKFKINYSITI